MKNKLTYLDNAATTILDKDVFQAMTPYLTEHYGNPSSVYSFARENKSVMKKTRDIAAKIIHAKAKDIYFTSGGTEAINWALKGVFFSQRDKGNHIISVKTEHHATLHALEFLEKMGARVTYLDVNEEGAIDLHSLKEAMGSDTILVSIMAANNEIGTMMPLKEIGSLCKEKGIIFHTDAVQAIGAMNIDVEEMHIDFLSASAHKFHGPKGIGFLYARSGIVFENLIHGGNQERGRRSGTENVAGIVGMGKALEILMAEMDEKNAKLKKLRDLLMDELLLMEDTKLNGPEKSGRLPNNVNVSFKGVDGESLLLNLDLAGILASSGSACTSGAIDASHVLQAINVPEEYIHGSLRLSVSKYNTEDEIQDAVEKIRETVMRLRKLSRR
ncbi:cysteine desulfurase family protein [Proteiniclasticum ruminis]|uniref:cysteine desulfurase family protein n=1 Tax=Proteiniclasticum ruminis TaxID=398199 RepID=UPI0028AF70F0|nr:cysteine desulfurase family protein [Proteiniclasticum ruminis]